MNDAKFNSLIKIYQATRFESGIEQGSLYIEKEQQVDLLKSLLEMPDDYGITIIEGNVDSLKIGDQIKLCFEAPKLSIGIFALNFADFLNTPKAYFREPKRYFLANINFVSGQKEFALLKSYRQVLSFINLLKLSADYFEENDGALVFLLDRKFDVPIKYDQTNLEKVDDSALSKILNSFEDDIHKEQKLTILANSVQSLLSNCNIAKRFSHLLENLTELERKIAEGYRLFVSEFSYDKILDQMEIAKLEEITKIHKTFSDIQNQILGIPVATVIVATQMKYVSEMDAGFWVNTSILAGCWIFAILSNFVLRNQLHTLEVIDEEIDRKEQQLIKNYNTVRDLIGKSFPVLKNRLKWQKIAFRVVDAIIVIGVILAHFVYFALTDPSRNFIINYYLKFVGF